MTSIRYSQVKIGDELPEVGCLVSQDVIDAYAVASLDYNPVHTNIEWCTRAQVFGMPCTVGHGMFTMSLMTSVIVRGWGAANARVRSIEVKFTKPVAVGTLLRCTGKVKELHPIGPGRNFVVVDLHAMDTTGATMGIGSAAVGLTD